jgi:ADP-ribose pyrophosphatase YjhB (NUDIX family)
VLLQKRQNTSFANGFWEAGAAGHVDQGENFLDAAIHEAKEELCIDINIKDLELKTLVNKRIAKNDARYNFHLICKKWKGTPKIGEPEKCSEIKWFDIKKLPKKVIDDRELVLKNFDKDKNMLLVNWKD